MQIMTPSIYQPSEADMTMQSGVVQYRSARKEHPLAGYARLHESLLRWVTTFEELSFKPMSLDELILSGSFYQMLSEIDPTYFPHLNPKIVKREPQKLAQDITVLKSIYTKLLKNLENWFAVKLDDTIIFDAEMISLKRLIGQKDPSELLFLTEYILIVACRGERKDLMIQRILDLPEEDQTNLQSLIQRTLAEESASHYG